MSTPAPRTRPGPRAYLRTVTVLTAAVMAFAGVGALLAPDRFARLANFPYGAHYLHDAGAFQLRIGATTLLALLWRDSLAVVLAGEHRRGRRSRIRAHLRPALEGEAVAEHPVGDVAPCATRGRVTGAALDARATLLDGPAAATASRALARKYPLLQGLVVPVSHRILRYRTLHYALTPTVANAHGDDPRCPAAEIVV